MKRRAFVSLAVTLWLATTAGAAGDLAPLVHATQRVARDPHALTVVWWMPRAFIERTLEQSPFSNDQRRATLASLDGYALFGLLHVSRDHAGALVLASREEVLSNSRLEVQGKTLNALAPGQISTAAQQILEGMQRGLTRGMGLNGQSLYIVAYPTSQDGSFLFDQKVTANFTFHSYGHDFVFPTQLPMGSGK